MLVQGSLIIENSVLKDILNLGHCQKIIHWPLPLGKLALDLEDLDGEEKCDFLVCSPHFPHMLASSRQR